MVYADFEEIKREFPARNFDNVDITEDFNIAAQNGAGVYGAFKFFHGIKSFFKGISALGQLASGSKILVTDDNGNISYTTPSAITNGLATTESVNNALANQTNYNVIMNIADCNEAYSTSTKFSVYRTSSITLNRPMSDKLFVIYANTYNDGTNICVTQIAYENGADGNIYSYTRKGYKSGNEGMTWTDWAKIITVNDVKKVTRTLTFAYQSGAIGTRGAQVEITSVPTMEKLLDVHVNYILSSGDYIPIIFESSGKFYLNLYRASTNAVSSSEISVEFTYI